MNRDELKKQIDLALDAMEALKFEDLHAALADKEVIKHTLIDSIDKYTANQLAERLIAEKRKLLVEIGKQISETIFIKDQKQYMQHLGVVSPLLSICTNKLHKLQKEAEKYAIQE